MRLSGARVLLPGAADAPGRPPSAALAALDGLRRTFAAVVVDTGAAVDDEHGTRGAELGRRRPRDAEESRDPDISSLAPESFGDSEATGVRHRR